MKIDIKYKGKYCMTYCPLLREEEKSSIYKGKARCIKFGKLAAEKNKGIKSTCGFLYPPVYMFIRPDKCVKETKELKPEDIDIVNLPWGDL